MEFTNGTRQLSRLEDGSHKIEVQAQWNKLFFRSIFVLVPLMLNLSTFSMFINQFVAYKNKLITAVPSSISFLPNPNAPPYYNITSTTTPQHRLVLDSSTLKVYDFLEPPLQSFGHEPSQSMETFRNHYKRLSKFVFKFLSSLILQQGEHISFYLQTDVYDVRATQFSKSKCGRVWRLERTMTRVMTRELEQLIGGVIPRYKGIRWRPERKHPWVAEIKVSQKTTKKKLWIGDFDTPEEAARAYDVVVIRYKKKTTLNFEDSCKHISNSTLRSTMASDQKSIIGSSFEVSTSQSMPLGSHISLGEASVQTRAMPTCALVNQACKMNLPIMHVDFEPNSTNIMTLEKYPTLEVVDQELGEVNTNNKTSRALENESKSYFMFASDFPSMIDTSHVLERTGSSSKHGVYDMHSHELFIFGTVKVEDVESVEMNTNLVTSWPSIEGTK
jgi:hypothetical protein